VPSGTARARAGGRTAAEARGFVGEHDLAQAAGPDRDHCDDPGVAGFVLPAAAGVEDPRSGRQLAWHTHDGFTLGDQPLSELDTNPPAPSTAQVRCFHRLASRREGRRLLHDVLTLSSHTNESNTQTIKARRPVKRSAHRDAFTSGSVAVNT